jgi:hypothetical protein
LDLYQLMIKPADVERCRPENYILWGEYASYSEAQQVGFRLKKGGTTKNFFVKNKDEVP